VDDSNPLDDSNELLDFLLQWIDTWTWQKSHDVLQQNSDLLLSDDMLAVLDVLLAANQDDGSGDAEVLEMVSELQQHRTILEQARASSIEEAYVDLLKPSSAAPELEQALEAFISVENRSQLRRVIELHPILRTQEAISAIETDLGALRAAGQEQEQTAASIEERYDYLKHIISQTPFDIAHEALLAAGGPWQIRQVVELHPLLREEVTINALLDVVNDAEKSGNITVAQALRLRINEVRRICGQIVLGDPGVVDIDAPMLLPVVDTPGMEIAARNRSIAIGRNDGTVNQTTNQPTYVYNVLPDRKWLMPPRWSFREGKEFVGRSDVLPELIKRLDAGEQVTITGQVRAASVQGMAGVGKTYLARKVQQELQERFIGGCIWLTLGPGVVNQANAQLKLVELAQYAFDGHSPPLPINQLQPGIVASWLAQSAPGRFVVVLDDAWHMEPLRYLEGALPDMAARIVTTRYDSIARALGGHAISLDTLTEVEGLALLSNRLRLNEQEQAQHLEALKQLVTLLGGHALALDIAAGVIKRVSHINNVLKKLEDEVGQGVLDRLQLHLPGEEERNSNLEKSLALSYEMMTAEQKAHLRALGVFEPGTLITVAAAQAVWGMDDTSAAEDALSALEDAALLTEAAGVEASDFTYRQHGLLRAYARALLDQAGELTSSYWAYTHFYTQMVQNTAVADYSTLDEHIANILAALQWASRHESLMLAELLSDAFEFLVVRGQAEKIEPYLPDAIQAATSANRNNVLASLLKKQGDLERHLGQLDEARMHYQLALPLYQQEHSYIGQANTHWSLGNLEQHLGLLDEAREHFQLALSLYTQECNRLGEANTHRSLGDLEQHLGLLDEAREHFQLALSLYALERNRLGEAGVYRRIGDMFVGQEDWTQAKIYYEQALPLFVAEREPIGQANTLIDLGRARFILGEHEQGMEDVRRAGSLFRSQHIEEWAERAEGYLNWMRMQLAQQAISAKLPPTKQELFNAFVAVESTEAMREMVEEHGELVSDEWFGMLEGVIEQVEDETVKQRLAESFETLRQIRAGMGAEVEEKEKAENEIAEGESREQG
jgi:tetratricopeptide (TPR) repeat protein